MRKEILKTLIQEIEKKESENSILKWLDSNQIKNEKEVLITFDRHPFLIDIYNDFHPLQVQEKCSQCGMSTAAILKTFFLGKTKNYSIIHTLPTADFSLDFVKSKVDPIIRANSEVFDINRRIDSTRHKQMNLSHFFYRGTFTEKEGISITADVIINDEYDRSDLNVCGVFESRLDFSEYKAKWKFSNPSVPQYGVDALWQESDQKHWFVKCGHCSKWQYLMWPENIDFKKEVFMCIKCKGEITDEDRINGLWVDKYKNRDTHGYWVSQMFCVWHTAKDIIKKFHNQKRDVFYNFTIGVPYVGSDVNVRREHIIRCLEETSLPSSKAKIKVMGIDQGSTFHVVVGGVEGIDRIYTLSSWDEVGKEIARIRPEICVIDGLPETAKVAELQEKHGVGTIFPAFYKDNPADPRIYRWENQKKNRGASAVYIDRYRSIDDLMREVFEAEIRIYMTSSSPMVELLVAHFESMYRTQKENKNGQTINLWESSTKNDHFVHAMNYWLAAMKKIKTYIAHQMDDNDEKNRPYKNFETSDERMARYKMEHDQVQDIPNYLFYDDDYFI